MSTQWLEALIKLDQRGAPDKLLRQLADMGEDGAVLSEALLRSSDAEWETLVHAWVKL